MTEPWILDWELFLPAVMHLKTNNQNAYHKLVQRQIELANIASPVLAGIHTQYPILDNCKQLVCTLNKSIDLPSARETQFYICWKSTCNFNISAYEISSPEALAATKAIMADMMEILREG